MDLNCLDYDSDHGSQIFARSLNMLSFGKCIPVLDLFSGPGGLGEGFASLNEGKSFRIMLSAEMDSAAFMTLRLRSYFRLLQYSGVSRKAYYDFCNGYAKNPWSGTLSEDLWEEAGNEAMNIELGTEKGDHALFSAIDSRIKKSDISVLIGGPPCQAYSLAGRSRNRGKPEYRPEEDSRHFLYREYLRVIRLTRPAVFIMENVKGILSSCVSGRRIFHDIINDLSSTSAGTNCDYPDDLNYRIYSLSTGTYFCSGMDISDINPKDFIIKTEEHGIPQARHRVILLGVRSDIEKTPRVLSRCDYSPTVWDAISDLPRIRSTISKGGDSDKLWVDTVRNALSELAKSAAMMGNLEFEEYLQKACANVTELTRGEKG